MTDFKKYLSLRNLCYHFSKEAIWLQNKAPFGVNLGERCPPTPFLTTVARLLHNLGYHYRGHHTMDQNERFILEVFSDYV